MYEMRFSAIILFIAAVCIFMSCDPSQKSEKDKQLPNIVLIYADDLGYGDLSSYGMTNLSTPNIDRIACEGLKFTNAHTSSATCTPSRFSMLTGSYAWREKGTGIAPGNAAMIIEPGRETIASLLKRAGYRTGVVGKWHLGLGPDGGPDWKGEIKPGPLEIGFDYSFLIPATGDRVHCVYVENYHVVGLDPDDPVQVSYVDPIGNEPTGKDNPELLKMKHSHGHNNTIINGIGRIGYMTGGHAARWVDEDMADVITGKALNFIEQQGRDPFFLYFSTHDIHVPRVPNSRFVGKSGMGPRGDAIVQLDWCTGEILNALDRLGLAANTLIIFTSDNGPVLDDGYQDSAVVKINGHQPSGMLRGGKYSAFDAGTRVPLIVRWPGKVIVGESGALMSQVDFLAIFAAITNQEFKRSEAGDSQDQLDALLGKSKTGRDHLVESARALSVIKGDWKYIEPNDGPGISKNVNIELGNDTIPQLYDLKNDIGELNNVSDIHPEKVKELADLLNEIITKEGRP